MNFEERARILALSDAELLSKCRCDAYCVSGPGGQHRNRNYTGVRLTLLSDSAITASDETERSQLANRRKALAKLRKKIAMEYRTELPVDAEYAHTSLDNPLYANNLAIMLDALDEAALDHKKAAERLALTPTRLLKELYRDPEVWQRFQTMRREAGLTELRAPRG